MKYLKVFTDFLQDIEPLSFEERGRLFTAMLQYADTGEADDLAGNERFLWGTAKRYINAQAEAYVAQCERNKKNRNESLQTVTSRDESSPVVTKNDESSQDKDKDKDKDYKEKLSKESKKKVPVSRNPPSKEDVEAYCAQAGISIDVDEFLDWYEGTNWKTSGGTPLYDWKCAARRWARSNRRTSYRPSPKPIQPQYNNAALEALEVQL